MNGWQSYEAPGQNKPIVPEPAHHGMVLLALVVVMVAWHYRRRR